MEDFQAHIKELNHSVQTLLNQLNSFKRENSSLKELLEKQDSELLEKEKFINQLQLKYTAFTSVSNMDTTEKLQLHARIDGYLKEIEKCLELLNY